MGAPALAYVAVLAAGLVPMVAFLLVLRMAKAPVPRRKQGRPVIGHPEAPNDDVDSEAPSPSRYFDNRPATVFLDGDTDFDKAPSPMSPGAEDEQVESKKIGGGINRGGEHRSTQRRDGEEASGGGDDDNEPTLKRAESDDSMGWSSDEEDRARKDKFAKIKIKAKAEVNEEETAEDLKNSFKSFSLGAASIGGGPMQGSRAARGSVAGNAAKLDTLAGFGTAPETNPAHTTRVVLPAPLPEPLVPPAAEALDALKRYLREAGVKLWLPKYSDSGTGAVVEDSWAALVAAVVGRTGLGQPDADAGLKWLRIKSFNKRLAELNGRGYSDTAPAAPALAPDPFGASGAVGVDAADPFGAAAAADPFGASASPLAAAASPDPFGANTPQASDAAAPPVFDPFGGAATPTSPAAAPAFDPFGAATAPVTPAAFDPFGDDVAPDAPAAVATAADPFGTVASPPHDPFASASADADPFGGPMSPDFNNMATPDPFGAGSPDPADGTMSPAMSPDAEL